MIYVLLLALRATTAFVISNNQIVLYEGSYDNNKDKLDYSYGLEEYIHNEFDGSGMMNEYGYEIYYEYESEDILVEHEFDYDADDFDEDQFDEYENDEYDFLPRFWENVIYCFHDLIDWFQ